MRTRAACAAAAIAIASGALRLGAAGEASDWSRFRGPNGAGVSEAAPVPAEFGPDRNLIWKAALPPGHSSPILSRRHVLATAVDGDDLATYALDRATGAVVWRAVAPRPRRQTVDRRNHPASPSPATDGSNVYVFFQDVGLIAYDERGRQRWLLPLGPFSNAYGMGSSPIVVDDLVVLVADQAVGSFMIAVGRDDGRVRWRTERPESKTGHSTPIVRRPSKGPLELLVPGSFFLTAYAARTGEKLWWVSGLAFEMKATPVLGDDLLFIHGTSTAQFRDSHGGQVPAFETLAASDRDGNGRFSRDEIPDELARRWLKLMDLDGDGELNQTEWDYFRAARRTQGGLWAFRPGGRGDMTDASRRWHYERSVPQLPSPLLYRGVLYIVSDAGVVTALDPATGASRLQRRLDGAAESVYASPVAADGKIFIAGESGRVFVLGADPALPTLAVNDLGDLVYGTPALDQGRLYVRTRSVLYCFGTPPAAARPSSPGADARRR